MIKLEENLKLISKVIREQDLDFLLVITGRERIGKSSLALHIAAQVDPDFTVEQIVFDIQTLYEQVYKLQPGQVVIIDEGATAFFSRDAMSTDVKDGIKLLTVMGERNLFVILCVPSFFILDKYIREHRVSGLIKVVARGRFKYYSRRKLKASFFNPKTKRFSWGDPSFKDSFGKFNGKVWNAYTKKKSEYLADRKAPRLNGEDKLIPVIKLAKMAGVSRVTAIGWVRDGKVEGHKNPVGNWVVKETSALHYANPENHEHPRATRVVG